MACIQPSPELSYVLGAILGDGDFYKLRANAKHGVAYRIRLRVKDYDFIDEVNKCISKVKNRGAPYPVKEIPVSRTAWGKGTIFKLEAYSKEIYNILVDESKIHIIAKCFPESFVKGFADAEGGVYHNKRKTRKSFERWVHLTNTNLAILQFISHLLNRMGIKPKIHSRRDSRSGSVVYSLVIRRNIDLLKFAENIGFRIKRKMSKLKDACRSIMILRKDMPPRVELVNLANQGYTTHQIAEIYGISQPTASLWLRKAGVNRGRGGWQNWRQS